MKHLYDGQGCGCGDSCNCGDKCSCGNDGKKEEESDQPQSGPPGHGGE